MVYLTLLCSILIGGYFSLRYFAIRHALREMRLALDEIQEDLSRNQILRLPLPDKNLELLMRSLNNLLGNIRQERQNYRKQKEGLQRQMEHISHDLRTPLTVILGYLKLLEKTSDIAEREEAMATICRKAQALERLADQFYHFTLLASQDFEIMKEEVDVCRILREALLDNFQILEQAHLNVSSALPGHPVMVTGNAESLERVFSNLFQNAGRYASSYLEVSLTESPKGACITFTNDAHGLSPRDIPHLFERFYKQDPARSHGGTGLGLTIAKSLAEAMGGSLNAEACPTRDGARTALRFQLTLPPNTCRP